MTVMIIDGFRTDYVKNRGKVNVEVAVGRIRNPPLIFFMTLFYFGSIELITFFCYFCCHKTPSTICSVDESL